LGPPIQGLPPPPFFFALGAKALLGHFDEMPNRMLRCPFDWFCRRERFRNDAGVAGVVLLP
ncbi:hypothetical protein B5F40_03750, partial [Gordonibacter sp. An230]